MILGGKSSINLGWDDPPKQEKPQTKITTAPGGKSSVPSQPPKAPQEKGVGAPLDRVAHVKVSNPPGGKSSITFG